MRTNILKALLNIANNPVYKIKTVYKNKNRANSTGDALELYIKDSLAGTFEETDIEKINQSYSDSFSYLGNTNNPPDLIIRGGDAFEVKKTESLGGFIALNSSYPKNKLYSNDTRITNECRNCENDNGAWSEKDIVYTVGNIDNENLKNLWFVYGDCFCLNSDSLQELNSNIEESVKNFYSIQSPLNNLYQSNNLPFEYKSFEYLFPYLSFDKTYNTFCLIPNIKYNSFPNDDRKNLENNSNIKTTSVQIIDPKNRLERINAKLIQTNI